MLGTIVAGAGMAYANKDEAMDTDTASALGKGFLCSLGAFLAGQVLVVAGQVISVAGVLMAVGGGVLTSAGLVRHGLAYKQKRQTRIG